jgi:D-xylose transport system substrate-binding protein
MRTRAICLFLLAALAFACNNASKESGNTAVGSQNTTAGTGKKVKIGFAMATVKEERWQRDRDAFEAHCKEVNVECVITVADNNSSRRQMTSTICLRSGRCLVIAPQEATEAAAMVEKAKAQGVPVISYDRLINSDKIDLYISHQVPVSAQDRRICARRKCRRVTT